MKKIYLVIFALLMFTVTHAQFAIDLETGAAKFGYNDVRIPGNSGTLFSLSDNFENKLSPYFRARAQYTFNKRHTILALYAPFTRKVQECFHQAYTSRMNFSPRVIISTLPGNLIHTA